jgi:cytochrome c556
MREHLRAVQQIVGAVGAKDFDAISRAATTIGYSEQMGQMCNHMGAGAPGFTEQALRFHHTADKISEAARGRDMPGVLSALNETLTTCTGCHSVFKQRIVDETTLASLVGQSAPQPH